MEEPTLEFLRSCGLVVQRPSGRSLTGEVAAIEGVVVIFQRSQDIPQKVDEGSVDLAVCGLERWLESRIEGGDSLLAAQDLGFSRCELVVGVPDSWIDITSIADLADLSLEFHERGRELRLATKYPRLTQQFLLKRGITYFESILASGATEAAPIMGYADVIVEIMTSGATLRENRLKTIDGGTIVRSQACLVANRRLLKEDTTKLAKTKSLLEYIEAWRRAEGYYSVTGNVRGTSAEGAAQLLMKEPALSGLQGPTVAPVFSKEGERGWYAVTVVVPKELLLATVEHFRKVGGNGMTVSPAQYVFEGQCQLYAELLSSLHREGLG
jgi:ATP phosphoribosyltransferase